MMEKILYEVLNILIECVKMLMLYRGVLNGTLTWEKWKFLGAAGGIAIAGAGIMLLTEQMDVAYSFGIEIIVCMFLAEDRLKGRAMGYFVCYIIINIIDSIPSTIAVAAVGSYSVDNELDRLLINAGMSAVYPLLGIIWHKNQTEHQFVFRKIRWKTVLLFVLEFVACTVIIGGIQMFLAYGNINKVGGKEKTVIGILSSMGCMIMLLISIFHVIISASRDEYKELLENKEKYFQMNYHYYMEMHDFRHDMMKHLKNIYQFCLSGRIEKTMNYIQEINADIHNAGSMIDCGNEIISVVVNNIYDKAKGADIDFQCEGHVPEVDIRDVDLCTVFSNVLENAYESCLKVEGKKVIHITFKLKGERIHMYMENSTTETEIKEKQKLFTKKEGAHGIGMKNVCEVIERYEGIISWYAKDGIFVTKILL